jgi:ribosomal protein S27E
MATDRPYPSIFLDRSSNTRCGTCGTVLVSLPAADLGKSRGKQVVDCPSCKIVED